MIVGDPYWKSFLPFFASSSDSSVNLRQRYIIHIHRRHTSFFQYNFCWGVKPRGHGEPGATGLWRLFFHQMILSSTQTCARKTFFQRRKIFYVFGFSNIHTNNGPTHLILLDAKEHDIKYSIIFDFCHQAHVIDFKYLRCNFWQISNFLKDSRHFILSMHIL